MKGLPGLLIPVLLVGIAACDPVERTMRTSEFQRSLGAGEEYAVALVAVGRGPGELDAAAVLGLGYLERLRLGLGSPFRLADQALQDPRLEPDARRRLARAILARTLTGHAYEVDPFGLDRIGPAGLHGIGRLHLELIEGAVTEARDPRAGELAVRLAYTLATAEGSTGRRAVALASQAASLVRDRTLAREDVRRLVRAAEAEAVDPVDLVHAWRAERRFLVEAPLMVPPTLDAEREAMDLAPRLAATIRSYGPRVAEGGRSVRSGSPAPLLNPRAAARLAEIADSAPSPPQTPLVVALDVHRKELLQNPALTAPELAARGRLLDAGLSEEGFAAHAALVYHAGRTRRTAPALAALWAASALRAYAQEEVWFPGFAGPTARELEDRFGLAAVRFDESVPAEWRPYYRRMLDQSLSDLYRVFPSLSLRGLAIQIGETSGRGATLALHDPRRRMIFLPPATGAGTIAHEIAHDMDWQVALRRYRVRGDYGTDRATRVGEDRLAGALRQLAAARLEAPGTRDAESERHASRPAEIFARSVDWFAVVSLAREGRTNGYLSSVQDDVLTGYGTVLPPDVTGAAGAALVAILDEVAPVYASTRQWFLQSYGPDRILTPFDIARRVIELTSAGVERPAAFIQPSQEIALARFTAIERSRDEVLAAIDLWICRAPGARYDRRLEAARRQLVVAAAAARARGVALELGREIAGESGAQWLRRSFYGSPWAEAAVDPAVESLLEDIAAAALKVPEVPLPASESVFDLAAMRKLDCPEGAASLSPRF
jgi:hypothetical protein